MDYSGIRITRALIRVRKAIGVVVVYVRAWVRVRLETAYPSRNKRENPVQVIPSKSPTKT